MTRHLRPYARPAATIALCAAALSLDRIDYRLPGLALALAVILQVLGMMHEAQRRYDQRRFGGWMQ